MLWFCAILITVLALTSVWVFRERQQAVTKRIEIGQRLKALQKEKRIIFEFLHDLGEAFTENLDRDQLLKIILDGVQKVTEAHGAAIYLRDSGKNQLRAEVVTGMFPPPLPVPEAVADRIATRQDFLESLLKNEILPLDSATIIAAAARTNVPLWIENGAMDPRIPTFQNPLLQCRSYVAVPLTYRDEQLGVMALTTSPQGTVLDESDFEIIKSIADQAAFALHSAQMFSQLADKKRLDHDLAVAQEIQRILLPSHAPDLRDFTFSAINLPAAQVSGDYYDYIAVDDTHWGLAIADVSGKGVPASLIMAMCRSVLRSKALGCASPARVLREVNQLLHPDIKEDMFITMVYAVLNIETGEIRLARAGHELPLLYRHGQDLIETIHSPGMALGIDGGGIFDSVIRDITLRLEPMDTLLMYTDGINEAVDEEGREFGRENLKATLKTCAHLPAGDLISSIVERVRRFSSGHEQNDDITMAALQRRPL